MQKVLFQKMMEVASPACSRKWKEKDAEGKGKES